MALTSPKQQRNDSAGLSGPHAAGCSLPAIGNLSAADAPHLVFLQDPVAGTSYTLNLTDKTAWKDPVLRQVEPVCRAPQITTSTFVMQPRVGTFPRRSAATADGDMQKFA